MTEKNWSWSEWVDRSPAHRRVLEFLTLDVQNSLEWVEDILAKIEALETGKISEWTRSGNAYSLEFSPETVTIETIAKDGEPIETISLTEFKQAVLAWQEKIEIDSGD